MIIPDVNLLLYACDSTSTAHSKAAAWWQAILSGTEPIGLPEVVVFSFVRIATNSRAFQNPLTVKEANAIVRSWWQQPIVQILQPGPEHLEQVLQLLEGLGTAGNLVTDAQIAAFCIDQDAVLHTADADFARFKGLTWRNPLTGARSRNPQ